MKPINLYYSIAICLREARETNYWYRVIDKLDIGDGELRKYLLQESYELKLIFGSIYSKCYMKAKNEK